MSLPDHLIEVLCEAGRSLEERSNLIGQDGVRSVTVVGSLARGDFVERGSDVDVMFVHTLGVRPADELCAIPSLRNVVHHFGSPALRLGAATGRQKPFMVDCHFVDCEILEQQPQWADPACFRQEHTERDWNLWVYAFDFVANRIRLWGEDPVHFVHVYPPESYILWALGRLQGTLSELQGGGAREAALSPEIVGRWKVLAGTLLHLAAIYHGSPTLGKTEAYREFQELVPDFNGKNFAEVLWTEYLHGTEPADRGEWLTRCEEFCQGTATMIASS